MSGFSAPFITAVGTHVAPGTGSVNTTGATLIVAVVSSSRADSTFSDSAGNTWLKVADYGPADLAYSDNYVSMFYCIAPTTSTSHTFTQTGGTNPAAAGIFVEAYNAAGTITLDQHNGTVVTTATGPQPTGSITPSQNGALCVAGIKPYGAGSYGFTLDSGYTVSSTITTNYDTNYGGGIGHYIQTTAAAVNPAWTYGNEYAPVSTIHASFKIALPPAAAPSTFFNQLLGNNHV